MTDHGFELAFDRLNEGVKGIGGLPEVPADAVEGVVSSRVSDEGYVRVEVCDGLLTRLYVMPGVSTSGRFFDQLMQLINDALSENQAAVLEELRRVSVPYDELAKLIDGTTSDIKAAVERSLRGSS